VGEGGYMAEDGDCICPLLKRVCLKGNCTWFIYTPKKDEVLGKGNGLCAIEYLGMNQKWERLRNLFGR